MLCDNQYSAKPNHTYFITIIQISIFLPNSWAANKVTRSAKHNIRPVNVRQSTTQLSDFQCHFQLDRIHAQLLCLLCIQTGVYDHAHIRHSLLIIQFQKIPEKTTEGLIQRHSWHKSYGTSLTIKGTCIMKNAGLVGGDVNSLTKTCVENHRPKCHLYIVGSQLRHCRETEFHIEVLPKQDIGSAEMPYYNTTVTQKCKCTIQKCHMIIALC